MGGQLGRQSDIMLGDGGGRLIRGGSEGEGYVDVLSVYGEGGEGVGEEVQVLRKVIHSSVRT